MNNSLSTAFKVIVFLASTFGSFMNANAGTFVCHTDGSWTGGAAVWTIVGDADGIPDADDDITIPTGRTVALVNGALHRCRNVVVENNAIFDGGFNFNTRLEVSGDYDMEGTETRKVTIMFKGAGTTISGGGDFGDFWNVQIVTSRIILSDVTWYKERWLRIYNGSDLTNQGNVTFAREAIAYSGATDFFNEGTLTIRSSNFLNLGRLHTDFAGNTVILDWNPAITGNLNIPQTENGFHNLQVNFSSFNYRFTEDIVVANDFIIQNSSPVVDLDGFNFNVGGDWINNGGGITTTGTSSVITFDGTGVQNITTSLSSAQTLFNTVVGPNSTLTLGTNLSINGNFTVNGALDASGSNHDITVTGNVDIQGTLNMQEGLFTMSGSTSQTMDASGTVNFYNLTIDNSGAGLGVDINSGSYTIDNNIRLDDGFLNLNGNSLTLLANGTQSARIRFLAGASNINGNVTLQRNIAGGSADYRDLSNPFRGSIIDFSQWDDDMIISGSGMPDGCAYGGGCFASIKTFDASTQQYSDVHNVSDFMGNATGYEVFLGDDLNSYSGTQIDITGQPNGPAGFPTQLRPGWNLVGNPYACELDWHEMNVGSGVGDFFYIYDSGTGNFEYYEVTGPGTGVSTGNINSNGFIASMQGFWVNSSVTTNLVIDQFSKGESNVSFVKSKNVVYDNLLTIKIDNLNNGYSCKSNIEFDDFAQNDLDEFDIPLFRGPQKPTTKKSPLLFFPVDQEGLRLNSMPFSYGDLRIPVAINTEIDGNFSISADNLDAFNSYSCIHLLDLTTGAVTNLKTNSYEFVQTGSLKDLNRFEILLTNDLACSSADVAHEDFTLEQVINYNLGYTEGGLRVTLLEDDHSDNYNVSVYDMLGNLVLSGTMNNNVFELNKDNLSSGMYVLKIHNGSKITSTTINISK